MGTWDHGLLDNDCASDGLFELRETVVADLRKSAAVKPSPTATARLGAAIGVLLQLSDQPFAGDTGKEITAAAQAHAGAAASFPPPFRRLLAEVAADRGAPLAQRPAKLPASQSQLLHVGSQRPPFGKREPALFASTAAAAYAQQVARRCVRMVDADFADRSNWSDLCREGVGLGGLAVLLVLAPCAVSTAKLEGWRRKANTGLAALEREDDEELPFHRKYHANLDRIFVALLRRFAAHD